MRLKKIKLAGFKSFVDPTTIPITAGMTCVVGPNGCGKSNIIDAIRWVMGESSAKNLRGDSLADVIFSGSTSRKPVGKAMVELVFDNTEGKAPGQYASYAEIGIRREVSRDGQSDYFINKTRCRKKDVVDIFLGTGLGPRSYSIIEQGMVTRIIESKPEDLRGFLEEAAGISRYKERRRETENRIRHTRENLDRVNDIRTELEKQLNRLDRQAKAAAKYKELKAEERAQQAQLLALRHHDLDARRAEIDGRLSTAEVDMEKEIAVMREIEARIEAVRVERTETTDRFNAVQQEFYGVGAEIGNIEQAIGHARESRAQKEREQDEVEHAWAEASRHLETDTGTIDRLKTELAEGEGEMGRLKSVREQAAGVLTTAEEALADWQARWEQFSTAAAEPARVVEIQRARLEKLAEHSTRLNERRTRLNDERDKIEASLGASELSGLKGQAAEHASHGEALAAKIETAQTRMRELGAEAEKAGAELEVERGEAQRIDARLAGLRALQDAAQGKHNSTISEWLAARSLDEAPRLAADLEVDAGWERAVERVLGTSLNAVKVSDIADFGAELAGDKALDMMLIDGHEAEAGTIEGRRLSALVRARHLPAGLLASVYAVDTLDEALALRPRLKAGESVITPDGVWIGVNWISIESSEGARAGILKREQQIHGLEAEAELLALKLETLGATYDKARAAFAEVEGERDEMRRELDSLNRERAAFAERLGGAEAEHAQKAARQGQIEAELSEINGELERDESEQMQAERLLVEAQDSAGEHDHRRAQLGVERDDLQARLGEAQSVAREADKHWHELEMRHSRRQSSLESAEQSVARLKGQLEHLASRRARLAEGLAEGDAPEVALKARLEEMLQSRLEVEARLASARDAARAIDDRMREVEAERGTQDKLMRERREGMEQIRVQRQELVVRIENVVEQFVDTGHTLEAAIAQLGDDQTEAATRERLESIERRISRLGAINLIAIEEYEQEAERKGYLDKQYEDLAKALETLEDAMRKIDRETRTRFKETFDQVNTGVQAFFPQLFGGGHAYLELTGDDMLTTGVAVMARPPGKRNSTIHLLSGGEKALTAVALLFAIFELNPAPFCLLDEVDAPLDDANVERYSETLKKLSDSTQLVYISHNKISMEMAEVLIGVTMSEPGVSRLVAVDVDEAMEMVAQ